MWVERLIEGDRNARIRLDKQPLDARQGRARRLVKHAAWLVIAVGDRRRLDLLFHRRADAGARPLHRPGARPRSTSSSALFTAHDLCAGRLGARAGLHLYVPLAAHPGGDARRGLAASSPIATGAASRAASTRRARAGRAAATASTATPACAVCPTGIDIRDGQQLECIGCGLCIDACDDVMDKVGRPRGLIAFDTDRQPTRARRARQDAASALHSAAHHRLRGDPAGGHRRACMACRLAAAQLAARGQRHRRPAAALRAAFRRLDPQRLHVQDPQHEPASATHLRLRAIAPGPATALARSRSWARHRSRRRAQGVPLTVKRATPSAPSTPIVHAPPKTGRPSAESASCSSTRARNTRDRATTTRRSAARTTDLRRSGRGRGSCSLIRLPMGHAGDDRWWFPVFVVGCGGRRQRRARPISP